MEDEKTSLRIAQSYSEAFSNKLDLNIRFEKLKVVEIAQEVCSSENAEEDSVYLKKLLKKLRKSQNLEELEFIFTLSIRFHDKLSKTISKISFGYLFYHSKLIDLKLVFDDLLPHHKAAIWRTVEQNYRTLKILKVKHHNKNFTLIPTFRTKNTVHLKVLNLSGLKVSDLWMLSRFKKNLTTQYFNLLKVQRHEDAESAGKYFMDTVVRKRTKLNINVSSSLALSSSYTELRDFLKLHKLLR